jgi:quercetin dioxygenase-like cupin family protein
MFRRRKLAVCVVLALVTILAGTALAFSNIVFKLGTVASYDFGGYGPGYPVPGTIQIQGFRMKPGETVPWHYHKGISYVILSHGTLTEEHVIGANQCASEQVPAGSAFVEGPGQVHTVTNSGADVAVIWWATIYPKSDDGSGGIFTAEDPNCH